MMTAWATAKDKYMAGNYFYLLDYVLLIILGSAAAIYLFSHFIQIA